MTKRWMLVPFAAAVAGTAVLAAVGLTAFASPAGSPNPAIAPRQAPTEARAALSEEPLGRGAMRIAQAIADRFGVPRQEVIDLHAQGIGFGAMVKLYALAEVRNVTVGQVIASAPGGDIGALIEALPLHEREAFHQLGIRGVGHLVKGCPPGLAKQGRC